MTKKTRLQELQDAVNEVGLYVATYSPGDGVTRYRFFDTPDNDYFGPENGIFTALGYKEAHAFMRGAHARQNVEHRSTNA